MLLNREEIQALDIVDSPRPGHTRSSSYDVSVGTIFRPDGTDTTSFLLRPQQMVMVLSAERLLLPDDVAGYAMPKTGLSNKGILALSTGIIDPSYEGRASSILINFGKQSFMLEEGESFLRITFHKIEHLRPDLLVAPPEYTDEEYRKDRRAVAVDLPEKFLDIPSITSEVTRRVAESQRVFTSRVASYAAVGLAVATFLVALITFWGAPIVDAYIAGDVKKDAIREIRSEEVVPLEQRVSDLEKRLDALESSSNARQTESRLRRNGIVSKERGRPS